MVKNKEKPSEKAKHTDTSVKHPLPKIFPGNLINRARGSHMHPLIRPEDPKKKKLRLTDRILEHPE